MIAAECYRAQPAAMQAATPETGVQILPINFFNKSSTLYLGYLAI